MARKHSFMGYHEKDKRSKYFSFEDGKRPTGDMSWNRKAYAQAVNHLIKHPPGTFTELPHKERNLISLKSTPEIDHLEIMQYGVNIEVINIYREEYPYALNKVKDKKGEEAYQVVFYNLDDATSPNVLSEFEENIHIHYVMEHSPELCSALSSVFTKNGFFLSEQRGILTILDPYLDLLVEEQAFGDLNVFENNISSLRTFTSPIDQSEDILIFQHLEHEYKALDSVVKLVNDCNKDQVEDI